MAQHFSDVQLLLLTLYNHFKKIPESSILLNDIMTNHNPESIAQDLAKADFARVFNQSNRWFATISYKGIKAVASDHFINQIHEVELYLISNNNHWVSVKDAAGLSSKLEVDYLIEELLEDNRFLIDMEKQSVKQKDEYFSKSLNIEVSY